MNKKTRILLKLTGNVLDPTKNTIELISRQLQELSALYQFGIVIGGGNFFRGSIQGQQFGMTKWAAHTAGMIATIMNGVILKDLLVQTGLRVELLSAIDCPLVASPINYATIDNAMAHNAIVIFAGGTGVPYFTTDTNAIIRCSQLGSTTVLKATNVNGAYDVDPNKNKEAKILKSISYDDALHRKIAIMDSTAYIMARDHGITTKIFNIFTPYSIVRVLQEPDFGSVFYV